VADFERNFIHLRAVIAVAAERDDARAIGEP
jgi:hypothetical protein